MPDAPKKRRITGALNSRSADKRIPEMVNIIRDIPKYWRPLLGFSVPALMAYWIAPPMPIPVPTACKNAVSGYAILTAARALSPRALPTKKPSAMA